MAIANRTTTPCPPHGLLNLLDEIGDRKIVGFPTTALHSSGNLCLAQTSGSAAGDLYAMPTRLAPGWSEVDAVGGACLLVSSRRVRICSILGLNARAT